MTVDHVDPQLIKAKKIFDRWVAAHAETEKAERELDAFTVRMRTETGLQTEIDAGKEKVSKLRSAENAILDELRVEFDRIDPDASEKETTP